MKKGSVFVLGLSILVIGPFGGLAQQPIPVTKNYVAWAHEFLRTMYPDMSGRKYFLSLGAACPYDSRAVLLQPDELYVGFEPEYRVLGFFAGYVKNPPSAKSNLLPEEVQPPGWLHPPQVLRAGFAFDTHDRLQSFLADGAAIGDREALRRVSAQIQDHPEMTDSEIIAALKKAGAKYGPGDKELLIKDFPYAKLGHFLGKLKIVSVDYPQPFPMNRDLGSENPWWEVIAEAKQRDGTVITYKLKFEQFKGDLISCGAGPDH